MYKEVQVGLIGYGFSGRTFHAPVLTTIPGLKLNTIVQRKGRSSQDRYPWVNVVDHVDALYQDDTIDLIIVTTPSTNHFKFVKDALLAGKHVVVEKPFTTSTEEADALIALAKQQNRMLSVFHNRRWDGDFLTLRSLLNEGILGQLTEAEFCWDHYHPTAQPGNWRDSQALGSGVLYDLGVHFIDQALCLFGTPHTLQAEIRQLRPRAITDDFFRVTLGYKEGLSLTLKSSMVAREPRPRYQFHGTKGSFIKYGTDPQERALINGHTPASPNWGREAKEWWGKINIMLNQLHIEGHIETLPGSYAAYYQNIYDHLTRQTELAVKAEEARQAIKLIELAKKSHEEQRTLEVN
ncbi:putative dehydrogenase [Pullulanibacillus pueri]|uniref:Oxidoreductase n=1 Tax=Pullulanibacillus pueri TaxID=1437324 RepID=A0A8J2ZVJ0_9BACL|nr:oxidoreductase [Pullulanibacillus pueri]MBM7681657.1 putative dehydrogenase [Pullulanibacillus pueri]GGH79282.1 oxidoreductase [Pullulanibacillus pueri]